MTALNIAPLMVEPTTQPDPAAIVINARSGMYSATRFGRFKHGSWDETAHAEANEDEIAAYNEARWAAEDLARETAAKQLVLDIQNISNPKLKKIAENYSKIDYNTYNYSVGGGLSDTGKKASNRHEEALSDGGKLTLGEATQLFKKATGMETGIVTEIIEYAVPNMEWHHAGFLPKSYGGGMKKTYFVNSEEIVKIALGWLDFISKLELSKIAKKQAEEQKKSLEERKLDFLKLNAVNISRVTERPPFFFKTKQEMNGKFGWFDSSYKSYKMTEYYSGWKFETLEKYIEFTSMQ